ncbi:18928_t:CDS:2, partial [Entrophospora sp. SA101]
KLNVDEINENSSNNIKINVTENGVFSSREDFVQNNLEKSNLTFADKIELLTNVLLKQQLDQMRQWNWTL